MLDLRNTVACLGVCVCLCVKGGGGVGLQSVLNDLSSGEIKSFF